MKGEFMKSYIIIGNDGQQYAVRADGYQVDYDKDRVKFVIDNGRGVYESVGFFMLTRIIGFYEVENV